VITVSSGPPRGLGVLRVTKREHNLGKLYDAHETMELERLRPPVCNTLCPLGCWLCCLEAINDYVLCVFLS
jgi:hypothetical protein